MLSRRPAARGMTLIEVLVGLTLLAIILALGAPGFSTWLTNSRVRTTAESLLAGLQMAKAEAVARNARVRFQLVDSLGDSCVIDAAGASWVVNLDPANEPDAVEGACGAEPSDTVAPRILHTRPGAESAAMTQVTASEATLVFNGLGRVTPVPAGDITIDVTAPAAGDCAAGGGEVACLRIVVSPAGQIRMCNPKFVLPDPQGC